MVTKINRKELWEALLIIQPGLAIKELVEQSTSVVFLANFLHTYNDEIYLSYPYKSDFEGAVGGKELFHLLGKCSNDEELKFSIEKNKLKIKGKRLQATVPYEKKISLPFEEIPKPDGTWNILPDSFCDDLKLCLFSVSKELLKPLLTCIHCYKDSIESCDDYRFTKRTLDKIFFPDALLLPGKIIKGLIDINPIKFFKVKGWIWFENEEKVQFACRTFETNKKYPDLNPYLTVEGSQMIFPEDTLNIIDRANIFTLDPILQQRTLKVYVKNSTLTISSQSHSGTFSESTRSRHRGNEIHLQVNPEFLKSVLSKISYECKIDNTRMKFEGNGYVHVVRVLSKPLEESPPNDEMHPHPDDLKDEESIPF